MKHKVLIVDDLEINILLLKKILRDQEYSFFSAKNGAEALQCLDENTPDLILLDIMMPVMDGFEFLKRKKEDTKISDIPVIVVSADNEDNSVRKALDLGAKKYIKKPVDLGNLNLCIQEILP